MQTPALDAIEARVSDMDRPLTMVRSDDLRALLDFARAGMEFTAAIQERAGVAGHLEARTKFVCAARHLAEQGTPTRVSA